MDKKKFGSYIKECRLNKNYTQQELANLLFVDVTTISKWERGVTYPDITMIPDICKELDITEHELIQASRDTEYRKIQKDAKKYNNMKKTTFWIINICYGLALITTFIVNLAVNHTLSWFFIVFSSLVVAYSFCPTFTYLFSKYKGIVFVVSTFVSLFILFLTCSIYSHNYWFMIATFGLLLAYFIILYPILFNRQKEYLDEDKFNQFKKWFLLTYLLGILVILILVYLAIYTYNKFNILLAIIITTSILSLGIIIGIFNIITRNKLPYKIIISCVIILFLMFSGFTLAHSLSIKSTEYTDRVSIESIFNSIEFHGKDYDINICKSVTNDSYLVCKGDKNVSFDYKIESGNLILECNDERKWYEKSFSFTNYQVDLYLASVTFDSLNIETFTGDCFVGQGLIFKEVKIKGSTCDIEFKSNVINDISIVTTTGDIELKNIMCSNLIVSCSTGDIEINDSIVNKNIELSATTGDIEIERLSCNKLNIKNKTGNIELENVKVVYDLTIKASTSDVKFSNLDVENIYIELTTGDVRGTLTSSKNFFVSSNTGKVNVPETFTGTNGICKIKVTTGDINISYSR